MRRRSELSRLKTHKNCGRVRKPSEMRLGSPIKCTHYPLEIPPVMRIERGISSQVGGLPWHGAPRRWGNALHAQCSYMAMFPPALPHFLIRWLSQPGDVVYDPFSGRGTTLLEAGLLGRIAAGSDANPLAWVLSAAKAQPATLEQLTDRIFKLRTRSPGSRVVDAPESIRPLFSPSVLSQLVSIKQQLDARKAVDRYLLATLCGILHLNARKDGTPRGLSVAMPNTFAMAPKYVARYIKQHGLRPPNVNVLEMLSERVHTLDSPDLKFPPGYAWIADATAQREWPRNLPRASLIVTSPPYLAVMKYGKLNWIRSWLVGSDPREIDRRLFTTSSLSKYLAFVTKTLEAASARLKPSGYMCLVVGDVHRNRKHVNLAHEVVNHCVPKTDFRVALTITDHLPTKHKVSRIWGPTRGRATKTDRIIVLAGPKAKHLPAIPAINWLAANRYEG